MKTMTTLLLSLVTLFLAIPMFLFGGEVTQSDVKQMQIFVEQNSLSEFLEAIEENKWKAPLISSQWYVDNNAPKDKRAVMSEAREFGCVLVNRLEEWAPIMASAKSSEDNERISKMFLQLADWLAVPKGYSNLFLAGRCQDIATVGIGRLLVDLDYPLARAEKLMKKFDVPWYSASMCLGVLNREAGVVLFTSNSKKEADIKKDINRIWTTGSLLLSARKVAKGRFSKKYKEKVKAEAMNYRGGLFESPLIQSNLDFFDDDAFSDITISPISSYINGKYHSKYKVGFRSPHITKLEGLLIYRSKVGDFPKDTSKEGFRESWLPYRTSETEYVYVYAWGVFEAIRQGRFLDLDSLWKINRGLIKK